MTHAPHILLTIFLITLTPGLTWACMSYYPPIEVLETIPADGAQDQPVNAPVILRWKVTNVERFRDNPAVSRGEFNVTMGLRSLSPDEDADRAPQSTVVSTNPGEMRYMLNTPLLADTDYIVTSTIDEEQVSWTFRTGSARIEGAPTLPFEGIETFTYTELARPVQACCPDTDSGECPSCRQTGWSYHRIVTMAFTPIESERPLRYALYQHQSDGEQEQRTLLQHIAPTHTSTLTISQEPPSDMGRFCMSIVAQYYTDEGVEELAQTPIKCASSLDFEPLTPLPEIFGGLDCDHRDSGPDMGMDMNGLVDEFDLGFYEDHEAGEREDERQREREEEARKQESDEEASAESGCGCASTPGDESGHALGGLLVLGLLGMRRRRRQ